MSTDSLVPPTKVLAIASHVVYGYVGNTMATFVMQTLGCEVSALNTVHFSNHTAYKQVQGTKATAADILRIWQGLKQSHLADFDVLLSGYAPGPESVDAIGTIAQELKAANDSLFWVMDPVMGDNGRLYVGADVPAAYERYLPHADLILPNQFEAEVLSAHKITSLPSLLAAVTTLHSKYRIPHVIVTSVRFSLSSSTTASATASTGNPPSTGTLSILGSTSTSTHTPRPFLVTVPDIDAFFSGTGDMFAALTVARLREACMAQNLCGRPGWRSDDDVSPLKLPLATAVERVCAAMHAVLVKTKGKMDGVVRRLDERGVEGRERELAITKAAEVDVVRSQEELRGGEVRWRAEEVGV